MAINYTICVKSMIKLEDCLFLDRIFWGVKMGQSQGTAVIHSRFLQEETMSKTGR